MKLILIMTLFAVWTGALPAAAQTWDKELPAMLHFGRNWSRTLLHLHSVYSHDACKGEPQKDGVINQKCLQQFRQALCDHHVDHAFITEHRKYMAHSDFNDILPQQEGDGVETVNGSVVKLTHSCPPDAEGLVHRVRFYPGSENGLMPLGLDRHPDLLPGMDLETTYNVRTPEAVVNFRNAGALVGVPHMEDKKKTIEELFALNPDYIEIYNVHANLIGLAKPLQLKLFSLIPDVAGFLIDPFKQPDLYALSFLSLSKEALKKWGQLAHLRRMPGVLGNDVHQNLPEVKMWDKEVMDSYRRVTRWYSNYIGAGPSASKAEIFTAVREGKVLGVFELLGIPNTFFLTAQAGDGSHTVGMGDEYSLQEGEEVIIRVAVPKVTNKNGAKKDPRIVTRLFRSDPDKGWVQVAESPKGAVEMIYRTRVPGAYRAEVWIQPRHLNQLMPGMFHFMWRKYPWIVSNPVYLR